MCSAPNVYMFVYILIGAHIVPLKVMCRMIHVIVLVRHVIRHSSYIHKYAGDFVTPTSIVTFREAHNNPNSECKQAVLKQKTGHFTVGWRDNLLNY